MAGEAGQGAVDRASNLVGYTVWSLATATLSADCTALAVFGDFAENDVVKFGFYTKSGNAFTLVSSVYSFTVTAGQAGTDKSLQWTSGGGDFTAFAVTAGWYLGCYHQGTQEYTASGGVGISYKGGDRTAGEPAATPATGALDALSADISAGGASTYNVTATAGMTLTDTGIAGISMQAAALAGIQLADTPQSTITIPAAAIADLELTDAPEATTIIPAAAIDNAEFADTGQATTIMVTAAVSGVVLTDAAAALVTLFASLADGLVLTDTVAGQLTYSFILSDGVQLSDVIATVSQFMVTVEAGITLADITTTAAELATGKMQVTITSNVASVTITAAKADISVAGASGTITVSN